MKQKQKDMLLLYVLSAAFAVTMLWGYVSGDIRSLTQRADPRARAAAEQRAMDHLFGSDRSFDPAADDVKSTAAGTGDTISWKTLAHAEMKFSPQRVEFGADVLEVRDTPITITGFIFPLQASASQSHFLLSAYPPSCPYCLPGGPTELVDVFPKKEVPFRYEPITLHGTLRLVGNEKIQEGMFYQLVDASVVK